MSSSLDRPASPKRRWFFKAALAVAATGAALGGGIWFKRGIDGTRLTPHGREVLEGLARGIVGPMLPTDPAQRRQVLDTYLASAEGLVASLGSAKRDQITLLLGALANAPTRYLASGMWTSWADASDADITTALEHLRDAGNDAQSVLFAGGKGLTLMAFFSSPETWPMTGYPGPIQL